MSEPIGDDPLERLRQGNPVDAERLPSASLARVRARFQEDSMGPPLRAPFGRGMRGVLAGVAGAAVAIALVALIAPRGIAPAPSATLSGGPISAACVETYSLDALAHRTFAFDGTVASIDGEDVTFDVEEAFRGIDGGAVTLSAPGMTGTAITSAGGPSLVLSERYLVAGDSRFVWACGFTQDYDPEIAAQWRTALAR